jgi:hypothetical protein
LLGNPDLCPDGTSYKEKTELHSTLTLSLSVPLRSKDRISIFSIAGLCRRPLRIGLQCHKQSF